MDNGFIISAWRNDASDKENLHNMKMLKWSLQPKGFLVILEGVARVTAGVPLTPVYVVPSLIPMSYPIFGMIRDLSLYYKQDYFIDVLEGRAYKATAKKRIPLGRVFGMETDCVHPDVVACAFIPEEKVLLYINNCQQKDRLWTTDLSSVQSLLSATKRKTLY